MTVWTIYCHIHIESGRRYVGLTKLTMMRRWNRHVYDALKRRRLATHFANALRKYGKDAFSHNVLEVYPTLEEANLAEERWIAHYDTRNPEKGFNIKKGGDHIPHPVKNPWDRPELREKVERTTLPKFIAAGNSPETRAKNKAALNTPESKAKRSASSKASHSRPEVMAKLSEAGKKGAASMTADGRLRSIAVLRSIPSNVRSRNAKLAWSPESTEKRRASLMQSYLERMTNPRCTKHGPLSEGEFKLRKYTSKERLPGAEWRVICRRCLKSHWKTYRERHRDRVNRNHRSFRRRKSERGNSL